MKRKSQLIIVAILAAAIAGASLAVAYSQSIGRQPFVKITINGLEDSYRATEPITFSAIIEGYGHPCGEIEGRIYGIDGNITVGPWAEVPNCASEQSEISFTHNFPIKNDSITTSLNQTGKYKLVISFEELPSHVRTTAEKQFDVTG